MFLSTEGDGEEIGCHSKTEERTRRCGSGGGALTLSRPDTWK